MSPAERDPNLIGASMQAQHTGGMGKPKKNALQVTTIHAYTNFKVSSPQSSREHLSPHCFEERKDEEWGLCVNKKTFEALK